MFICNHLKRSGSLISAATKRVEKNPRENRIQEESALEESAVATAEWLKRNLVCSKLPLQRRTELNETFMKAN